MTFFFCALVACFSCVPTSLPPSPCTACCSPLLPTLCLTFLSFILAHPSSPFAFLCWRQQSEKKRQPNEKCFNCRRPPVPRLLPPLLLSPFCPEQPLLLPLPLLSPSTPVRLLLPLTVIPSEHWQQKVQLSQRALPTKLFYHLS